MSYIAPIMGFHEHNQNMSELVCDITAQGTNISAVLHGITKSRDVVDIMHKTGLDISYNDVLMLQDFKVVSDPQVLIEVPHNTNMYVELSATFW